MKKIWCIFLALLFLGFSQSTRAEPASGVFVASHVQDGSISIREKGQDQWLAHFTRGFPIAMGLALSTGTFHFFDSGFGLNFRAEYSELKFVQTLRTPQGISNPPYSGGQEVSGSSISLHYGKALGELVYTFSREKKAHWQLFIGKGRADLHTRGNAYATHASDRSKQCAKVVNQREKDSVRDYCTEFAVNGSDMMSTTEYGIRYTKNDGERNGYFELSSAPPVELADETRINRYEPTTRLSVVISFSTFFSHR